MVNNIIIVVLRMVFFTIFTKCSKDIFFTLYLSVLVLLLNTFSLLKCVFFIIITLLYGGTQMR